MVVGTAVELKNTYFYDYIIKLEMHVERADLHQGGSLPP